MSPKPKVVVIGGGTGSFAILNGLKNLDIDLTALVSMADDGGSTGQLRDEYGVLPPGDIRQCLVALSDAPTSLRELFNFRFPGDSALGGHSFGNLFLSAVEMMTDNFSEAVLMASDILSIKGRVLPVTTEKCQLVLTTDNQEIVGQQAVENARIKKGTKPDLSLKPRAKLNPIAKEALEEANLIIIAPGSIYSSIIPALLVEGMQNVLSSVSSKVAYICNLVNKPSNTSGYKVTDYISELERYIGVDILTYVLYNVDLPSKELLKKYSAEEEFPVEIDIDNFKKFKYNFIPGKFLSHQNIKQDKNDILLKRSLIRHDSIAVAETVDWILSSIV